MISLNRRSLLGGAAAFAVPTIAVADPAPMTAQERYDFHLAEFKKAAEELDPMIAYWHQAGKPGDDAPCTLVMSAYRRCGRYEGDGLYEKGRASVNGYLTRYRVQLAEFKIDGDRMFEVSCPGERMFLTEPRLETFIGRRVA